MTNEEIEDKIKNFKNTLKTLELQIARDEEKLKNQNKLQEDYLIELRKYIPDIDVNNLESEIEKYENQLEADISILEAEIINVKKQIDQNK